MFVEDNYTELKSKLTKDIKVEVVLPPQITLSANSDDITYNKVLITAKLPKTVIKNYHTVICLTYALDVKQPICKVYKGYVDNSGNFYSFDEHDINIYKIEPNSKINYSFQNLLVRPSNFITSLKAIDGEKLNDLTDTELVGI